MARRRKDNTSDAEYYKTLKYLEESAAEELRLARAAAEAMPTAEELQAMQEAEELMKQAPTAQEIQEAQQALDDARRVYTLDDGGEVKEFFELTPQERAAATESLQSTLEAQQAELQRLLSLPFNEIALLPQEKQELVYAEMGRQLANTPEFVSGIETLVQLSQTIKREWETVVLPLAQRLTSKVDTEKLSSFFDNLRKIQIQIPDDFSDRVKLFQEVYPVLKPYIDAEYDENPEQYENATTGELIAAAAQRARADGKEIPRLWMEPEETAGGVQLEMQLDLPGKEESAEKETPAALIDAIKKMPVLNPQAHIMPNNALMNVMQKAGAINSGDFNLPVLPARGRQKKEITAYTIIDYNPEESGITITDPKVSEYERQVSDAVISLWVEANRQGVEPVFTTDAVYSAMPGGGDTASPQQKGAITKAIEKFRRTHMTVDATEELRRRGAISETDTFKFDEYYFQITRAKRTSKHSKQSVIAYRLTEKPVILKYAEMTKQILTVQPKYLTICKVKNDLISNELITMNAERQAMTGYMMRRIAVMKHDLDAAREKLKQYEKKRKKEPELEEKPLESFRQQSDTILFDTLFSATGTETDNREQARRNREFCFDVLTYWKATGFIKGYETQTKGKKITGIIIKL